MHVVISYKKVYTRFLNEIYGCNLMSQFFDVQNVNKKVKAIIYCDVLKIDLDKQNNIEVTG